MRHRMIAAAAATLALVACSPAQDAQTAQTAAPAEPVLSAEVLAKAVQWTAAPVHPAKPPIAGCVSAEDAATCASDRARFQDKAWPAAWGGDHDAADTVAYCLTSSCDGGVQLNPIQGCAWRQVIVASKDPKVDEDDAYLAERECGMLTAEMRVTAKARAAEIFREIYKRDLGG